MPRGFSLVELLVVLCIIGIISALMVPVVSSALQAARLNTAVNLVVDQMSYARQAALANSSRVEVRFYQMARNGGPATEYCGVRTFLISSSGSASPFGPVRKLPAPIVFSGKTNESPLFRNGAKFSGQEDLPSAPGTPFVKFSFSPSGRTDLESGRNWFVTLYDGVVAATAPNGLPKNYAVLQVDAFTGNVRIFRP